MENELMDKLTRLQSALEMVVQKVDEIAQRQDELDSVVYDGLIGPANEQIAQQEYDDALSDFRCKFGEKLDKFDALAKAEEGDDFDLVKKAFDDYNEHEYPFSPSEYIDKRVSQFEEKAKALAEAAGSVVKVETETPDGQEVEVTATPDGDVKTEVEGEEVKSEETKTEKPDEKVEEESKEDESKKDEDKEKKSWKDVAKETDFSSWNV